MSPRLLDLGNQNHDRQGQAGRGGSRKRLSATGQSIWAALGGAGALMAQSDKTLEVIAWPDLGCEAVRRLTVEDMPDGDSGCPRRRLVFIWARSLPGSTGEITQNRRMILVCLYKPTENGLQHPAECDILLYTNRAVMPGEQIPCGEKAGGRTNHADPPIRGRLP